MIGWAVAAVVIVALVWLVRKTKSREVVPNYTSFTIRLDDLRKRGASLTTSEQNELVVDARDLAARGYDRLFEAASQAGKDEHFAHQAGVLDAAFCVLANDDRLRQDEAVRRGMQVETVPFNNLSREAGRAAIIEYLVWRIFPDHAETGAFEPAIEQFVAKVVEDSESEPDARDFIHTMIFSTKAGWRDLAVAALQARTGGTNV